MPHACHIPKSECINVEKKDSRFCITMHLQNIMKWFCECNCDDITQRGLTNKNAIILATAEQQQAAASRSSLVSCATMRMKISSTGISAHHHHHHHHQHAKRIILSIGFGKLCTHRSCFAVLSESGAGMQSSPQQTGKQCVRASPDGGQKPLTVRSSGRPKK